MQTTGFTLAPLPYPYDALAPYISAETVRIHHDRHQAAYVKKLNEALANYPQYLCWPLERLLVECARLPACVRAAVHRNAGGVYAHELYFDGMTASPSCGAPDGRLSRAIENCFGSFEHFRDVFTQTAAALFGSGWCWLCCDARGALRILATQNQDTPLSLGLRPILTVDVWEHAYYLDYQNVRDEYLKNWWNLIDWPFAEENYCPRP